MKIQEITSAQNPKIKETVALMEKSKERRAQKLFVVEGIREVAACIRNGYTIKSIFFNSQIVTPQQIENLFPDNPSLDLNSTQLFSLSPAAYSKIAYRENTEGIVAVVEEKRLQLQEVKFGRQWKHPLVLVVESVEKPGNLGALLRTADACGIDAVLVCDPLTDLYNPKAEGGIPYNDETIGIEWPAIDCEVKLSEKDKKQPFFHDFTNPFL